MCSIIPSKENMSDAVYDRQDRLMYKHSNMLQQILLLCRWLEAVLVTWAKLQFNTICIFKIWKLYFCQINHLCWIFFYLTHPPPNLSPSRYLDVSKELGATFFFIFLRRKELVSWCLKQLVRIEKKYVYNFDKIIFQKHFNKARLIQNSWHFSFFF